MPAHPRCGAVPPSTTTHRHRARISTYGSQVATIPQPANPKLPGDRASACATTARMDEKTPPPQMPYLFAALASRAGGGLAHPPPRPLSWGIRGGSEPRSVWVGILPGKRPHPSSEQTHDSSILTQEKEHTKERTQHSRLRPVTARWQAGGFGTDRAALSAHFISLFMHSLTTGRCAAEAN